MGRALQAQWGVENNRALPEWGRAVFSDLCIMMRPAGEAELTAFVKYCIALAHAYLEVARHVQPPTSNLCARCSHLLLACIRAMPSMSALPLSRPAREMTCFCCK